ncbi:hypothetical protein D3C71_1606100 [compost metagenome]
MIRCEVGAAVETQCKEPVVETIAIALVVTKQRYFAADLWKQRGLAQLLVQVALMKLPARFDPTGVIGVRAQLELGGLLTQGIPVLHQEAERSILIAALLGEVVIGKQALPHPLAQGVDGVEVDHAQPQALL